MTPLVRLSAGNSFRTNLEVWHDVGACIESLWMMRVGSRIGYLDHEAANWAFRQNTTSLLQHFDAFINSWGDLLHPEVATYMAEAFSLKSLPYTSDVNESLWPVFQSAALRIDELNQRASVRDFTLGVCFMDSLSWERLQRERESYEVAEGLIEKDHWQRPADLDSVLAGCCLATEYVVGFVELLNDRNAYPEASETEWTWIRTELARSQRWRFGWGDLARKYRFTWILDKLSDQIGNELAEFSRLSGVSLTAVVSGYMDQLWSFQDQAMTGGGAG